MEPDEPQPEAAEPAKRGRGRPAGSKNKPKLTIEPIQEPVAEVPEEPAEEPSQDPEPPPPIPAPKPKPRPVPPPRVAPEPIAPVAKPHVANPVRNAVPAPGNIIPSPGVVIPTRKRPRVPRQAEALIAQVVPQAPAMSPQEQYRMHMEAMAQLRQQERVARQNHFDRLVGLV